MLRVKTMPHPRRCAGQSAPNESRESLTSSAQTGRAHRPVFAQGAPVVPHQPGTFSRVTLSAGSVGSLKCYDKGGIEKACTDKSDSLVNQIESWAMYPANKQSRSRSVP